VEPLERELKYSLVDAPPDAASMAALGRGGPYAFVEAGVTTHLDRYFDDDDGRLRAAGLALRQRWREGSAGRAGVATVKSAGRVDGAWHQREEIEAPMQGEDWPVPVARRVAAHVALWQLRPRLELEVERSSYRVAFEGRAVATLVFDRVIARSPGVERSAHFDEVELEALAGVERSVLEGAAELIDALVHLTASPVTKLERAAAVLALAAALDGTTEEAP
jgi:inorganic triphosphatase YgiF